MTGYGYAVEVAEGYDEAVIRSRVALKGEGFSIITEMHVGGLLGPEAGTERQYLIMGAWSPPAGDRTVDPDLQVAVHLPCNLVVQENGSSALVAALDPGDTVELPGSGDPGEVEEARNALERVLQKVSDPS